LLDNSTNLVNNYKTKYKISIFFTIKYSKTITTISKIVVSISLVNIIVFILLLKKRNRLSKIAENAFIPKKKIDCLRLKLLQIARKITISKYYFNIIVVDI